MKIFRTFIAGTVLLAGLTASCTKANVSQYHVLSSDCPDTISFAAKIQPLVQASCATGGCHDASSAAGGYNLTTHDNIAANASIMLSAMRWENGTAAMPDGGDQLADSLLQQFSCWIQQGKLNN